MMLQQINYYTERLQRENYKSFYLAVLRVGLSLYLLKEVCINWFSMDILYGKLAFVVPKGNMLHRLPGGFSWVRDYYLWFIISYIVVILLNILGVGRWLTALLVFSMLHVLQRMNTSFLNNGDSMAKMVLFYLIFANSYQYFVLVKRAYTGANRRKLQNLVSNLAALSVMIQLCVAYLGTGITKAIDPLWLHGEGIYYSLQMERFTGTIFNKYFIRYQWFDVVINYAVILFELLFPVLIWIKKIRTPLLITGIIFHLAIYIFLMIYGFQIVFVLTYGLFLPNDSLLNSARKLKTSLWKKN